MANNRKYPTGVRPSKHGGIEIRWHFNGRSYSKSIDKDPSSQTHLKEAAALRKKLIKELRYSFEFGLPEPSSHKEKYYTFADVADEFLDHLLKTDLVTFSTWQSYKSILKAHWLPTLRNLPIGVIDYSTLSNVFNKTIGRSKKTRKNILVPLSRVFEYAQTELRCIEHDPSNNLRVRLGQKPLIDPFTLEEQEAILSEIPQRSKLYYLIAFDTGMRSPSEILALKWSDFDGNSFSVTKGRVICRETTSTKTNKARTVQLTQRVITALNEFKPLSNSEWIFAYHNAAPMLKDTQQKKDWKATLNKLGIRYRRPYTCRHTRASLGLKAGVPSRWMAQQLGHSVIVLESTYAKWINEESDKKYIAMTEDYAMQRSKLISKPN